MLTNGYQVTDEMKNVKKKLSKCYKTFGEKIKNKNKLLLRFFMVNFFRENYTIQNIQSRLRQNLFDFKNHHLFLSFILPFKYCLTKKKLFLYNSN